MKRAGRICAYFSLIVALSFCTAIADPALLCADAYAVSYASIITSELPGGSESQTNPDQTEDPEQPSDPDPAVSSDPEPATVIKTGIVRKGKYYYYVDPKTKTIRKKAGFVKYKGKRYYIRKGGKIVTNKTLKIKNAKYHISKKGIILTGRHKWGKKYYYSSSKSGRVITSKGLLTTKKALYYIRADGSLATNVGLVIDNLPYYCTKKGVCKPLKTSTPGNAVLSVTQKQVGIMTGRKYWTWYSGTRFIDTDITPWCGAFVAWCYGQAGRYSKLSSIGNLAYVPSYSNYASRNSRWVLRKKARGGDIIVFGRNAHIGIVERVYKGYIFTIEGNSGPTAEIGSGLPGAVTRKVYRISDPKIYGIIRP